MKSINKTHLGISLILGVIFLTLFSLFPYTVLAGFGQDKPFGGYILTTDVPEAICADGGGPFTENPAEGPVGPISSAIGEINVGEITAGAWILGFITGDYECEMETYPYVLSTKQTDFYGTSSNN